MSCKSSLQKIFIPFYVHVFTESIHMLKHFSFCLFPSRLSILHLYVYFGNFLWILSKIWKDLMSSDCTNWKSLRVFQCSPFCRCRIELFERVEVCLGERKKNQKIWTINGLKWNIYKARLFSWYNSAQNKASVAGFLMLESKVEYWNWTFKKSSISPVIFNVKRSLVCLIIRW